jgi:hypothetical protein
MSFVIQQKTKVKVSIYGKEFELQKPTVGQVEELQKYSNVEEQTEQQKFESVCGFLEVLGLPRSFSMDMEVDHLVQLIEFLSGELNLTKKKSEAGQ